MTAAETDCLYNVNFRSAGVFKDSFMFYQGRTMELLKKSLVFLLHQIQGPKRLPRNRLVQCRGINYFTEMCSGSEEGSYSRLINFCMTREIIPCLPKRWSNWHVSTKNFPGIRFLQTNFSEALRSGFSQDMKHQSIIFFILTSLTSWCSSSNFLSKGGRAQECQSRHFDLLT